MEDTEAELGENGVSKDAGLDGILILSKRESLSKARNLLKYSNSKYLHYEYMARAVEIAKNSQPDDSGPYVGAVLVKNCKIIAEACKVREPLRRLVQGRSELHLYHAEEKAIQLAMEAESRGEPGPENAVLYVTLEPCVCRNVKNRRRILNTPCIDIITKARIKSVVIGLLDSENPNISGKGVIALANSGIEVVLYNAGLSKQLLELIKLGKMRRHSKAMEYLGDRLDSMKRKGTYIADKDEKSNESNINNGKKRESNRLKKIIDDGIKEYEENNNGKN